MERKQKHCSGDEATAGDCWDHTAIDPESRLVVSLVVGKRTAESVGALVRDFRDRIVQDEIRQRGLGCSHLTPPGEPHQPARIATRGYETTKYSTALLLSKPN